MKLYKIFSASLALLLGWSGTAFAQNEVDALRYSRLGITGSARIQGIGGAQTALGADISTMSVNPAGLGMFRRSEFSISPGLQFNTTTTSINGASLAQDKNAVAIPHAGLVLSNRKGDQEEGNWRGATFGISLSRQNNFNQQTFYRNTAQPPNTMVDYFADQAGVYSRTNQSLQNEFTNGIETLEGLAFGNYLINFQDVYGNDVPDAQGIYSLGDINQQEDIRRKGSQTQFDLGVGTSYKDKLYLGASMGIVTSNFKQESIFRESGYYIDRLDPENDAILLDGDYSLELRDEFTSRGTGVNLRIGAIYRPIDAVRIGASIQTPTAFTFSDTYNTSLHSTSVDPETEAPADYSESMLPGQFNYRLTTPLRANGGIAVFISKYGFITADVEYVNYGSSRFNDEEGNNTTYFSDKNDIIASTYKSAINYSLGAEGRYDVFRLRAGYAESGDPFRNVGFDGKVKNYTLGAGIRLQNYYLDAAYISSTGNSRYSPYTFSDGAGAPIVDIDQKQNTVMVTLGYNF